MKEEMMSDSEMWKIHHADRRDKRANNRDASARLLRDVGIVFTEHNGGAHLVVRKDKKTVDFWPGTGKWTVRGSSMYQRGVKNLIREMQS